MSRSHQCYRLSAGTSRPLSQHGRVWRLDSADVGLLVRPHRGRGTAPLQARGQQGQAEQRGGGPGRGLQEPLGRRDIRHFVVSKIGMDIGIYSKVNNTIDNHI